MFENPKTSAERLIATVESTGGLIAYPDGTFAPCADPDWIDLADAYLAACSETGRQPKISDDQREEE